MYYFNVKLISELSRIMGNSLEDLSANAGFCRSRLYGWIRNPNMQVSEFVLFLNKYRFSMADFLVTQEDVPVSKNKDRYVTPIEIWHPIEWNPSRLLDVLKKNDANINSLDGLARELGVSSGRVVSKWIKKEDTMKMCTLLDILNKLHVDAKELITDRNKVIELPEWEPMACKTEARLESVFKHSADMERQIKEKDRLIADLQQKIKDLRKEVSTLKTMVRSSAVAEQNMLYSPWKRKGYVFHSELWHKLPELFGMTKSDFCKLVGQHGTTFLRDNVSISSLVRACNELRISVSHFFPREGEAKVVWDRGYYEISKNIFQPIEDRTEDLMIILKNKLFGINKSMYTKATGLSFYTIESFSSDKTGTANMAVTLADICNKLGLSVGVFLYDPNEYKRSESFSALNETMALNCVELYKELQKRKGL